MDHDHRHDRHHDHHHDHNHDHGHDHGYHHHAPSVYDRAFAIGAGLNLAFVIAQVAAGLLSNSMALLADAGHNFGDVLSLLLSWGAVWLSRKAPTAHRTYGFGRSSILASLINAIVLLLSVGAIGFESLLRLAHPAEIQTGIVMLVAALGILINGATAMMFMRGHDDLNIRSAFLHMASDAAISLGVVIAALAIRLTGWTCIDPLVSLAIVAVIAVSTFHLLRDSLNLAMDAVPRNIDSGAVERYLQELPGVSAVHDLHIWPLSTTAVALTAHLVRPGSAVDDDWLYNVCGELRQRFSIHHSTIQIESGHAAHDCKLAPEEVI